MTFETIEYHEESGYAEITLNRPDRLNAFTAQMHEDLRGALTQIASDPEIRAVILTGAGRGFCAGQDLSERGNTSGVPDLGESLEKNYNALVKRLRALAAPVIVAINGVAAGAGANLALSGDLLLAAKSAQFIQAFCKIGLVPDCGGTYFLPRLIGEAKAKALALTGEPLDAETAERWGLVWKVVDDEQLLPEARKLAAHLATQPTKALGAMKQMLQASVNNSLEIQLDLERDTQREMGRSEDFREGVAAFLEKRPAVFTGR
ncbi:MAG: 2-(1,2-epoxy-1,2-dihydrophenyl)acetyl-CoA isomerase PaaG [SAR324 cluster bacterium]|nr:2-(1,2-epoxy-1,2-dihydrophenyl)acetyl-CoA isomerase PaaG [SAR324 cluster bacterium]